MDPWKSWAIVGVVGVGAAYYYSQSGKSKRGRGRPAATPVDQNQQRASSSRNDSKDIGKKKGKAKSSDASDQAASDAADVSSASPQTSPSEQVKRRKGGKQQPSKLAQSSASELSKERDLDRDNAEEQDEGMSNAEFAKQLSQLKTGTSLKKPVTTGETKKTRKQGKRNELPPEALNGGPPGMNGITRSQGMSTTSSTTGADADDDLSLPVSPEFGATESTTPSGLDVSDMLEPPSKGPSVLRLTEPVNQVPARQPKPQKAAAEPETKKQRQNRKKNEEKKAMREQAEQERRVMLEKQLRTAREAEGTPAKNGMGTARPPSTNAWNNPTNAPTKSEASTTTLKNGPLLDTLEDTEPTTGPSTKYTNGSGDSTVAEGKTWNRELPSEEEQIRLMSEMDSDNAWSTVPSGKGKKRSVVAGVGTGANKAESSGSKVPSLENVTPSYTTSQAPHNNNHEDDKLSTEAESTTASNDKVSSSTANASLNGKKTIKSSPTKSLESGNTNDQHGKQFSSYEDYMKAWREMRWSDGRLKDPAGGAVKATDTNASGEKPMIKTLRRRPKATYDTVDHSIWTYDNIKEHPDYEPKFPRALTGHPADSDWEGGKFKSFSRKSCDKVCFMLMFGRIWSSILSYIP